MTAPLLFLLSGVIAIPCGVVLLVNLLRSGALSEHAESSARGLRDIGISAVGGALIVAGAAATVGGTALLDL